MNFRTDHVYTETLNVAFGAIDKRRLAEILRDGRAAAFLVYEHLLAKFQNLRPAPAKGYLANCVMDEAGQVYLVRMVTDCGVALNPHKQNGVKRKFDKEEHLAVKARLDGYILVDVTRSPKLTYAFVSKEISVEAKYGSYEESRNLIDLANGAALLRKLAEKA